MQSRRELLQQLAAVVSLPKLGIYPDDPDAPAAGLEFHGNFGSASIGLDAEERHALVADAYKLLSGLPLDESATCVICGTPLKAGAEARRNHDRVQRTVARVHCDFLSGEQ